MEKLKPHRIPSNLAAVTAAFDSYAAAYDASFDSNAITQRLRRKIYGIVEELVPRSGSILDINCGTGTDACYFASRGYKVTGIDISPKMIEQAKAKGSAMKNVRFRTASFQSSSPTVEGKYDLILSNFGGLNCVRTLDIVANRIAQLTNPNGRVVAVLMPPFCAWEALAGLARFDLRFAFRRLKKHSMASGFAGESFQMFYHSLSGVQAAFAPHFTMKHIEGMWVFSPPPQATNFVRRFPRLSVALSHLDEVVSTLPWFRSIGDHYVVTLQKHLS